MSNKNKYYKKKWLSTIERVHPPKEEQEVNHKLRLHRAERLHPFPNNFDTIPHRFQFFLNKIVQNAF